jgi:hypothetical protein
LLGTVSLFIILVFNTDTLYRAHEKRLNHMPFDKNAYESQMNDPVKALNITEERKALLQNDINEQ